MRDLPTCLVAALAFGAVLVIAPSTSGQAPPTYSAPFRDPLPAFRLTQADLPNLGRLVSLEAMSMFIHAREELYDSPAGRQLLGDISDMWIAADAFTAAVWYDSPDARQATAGSLALPGLLSAYGRLRETMDVVPGRAQATAFDFWNMGRVVAVIVPIVEEANRAEQAVTPAPAPGGPADLLQRSGSLSSALGSMLHALDEPRLKGGVSHQLLEQLRLLSRLDQGFAAVVAEGPDDRDAVSSFRPMRSLATAIDGEVSRSRPPSAIRDAWRNVQSRVDDLAELLQLPREIVVAPPPNQAIPADGASVAAIDQALRRIDPLLNTSTDVVARQAASASVADDLRRLRLRLLVLRQQLVGREPSWRIARSTADVETARRRLGDRLNQPSGQGAMRAKELLKEVDESLTHVRQHLSGGH